MKFQDMLEQKTILVSDGAWGTEMAKHGLNPGDCPELLNADKPEVICAIARSYVQAGSDIILTNTFGGSPQKLARYGLENRTEELNEKGARLSVEMTQGKALVFASIGSTGEFLEPLGTIKAVDLIKSFGRQVRAFVAAGADGVLIETMTDLGETICALKAVKENSELPAVCSMTFDKGVQGYATMMGVKPDQAIDILEESRADAVGANCGSGIEDIIEVARIMRSESCLPLWMKPNAGLPELVKNQTVYRQSPEQMASYIPELLDAGATIVGGCCGSTPEHILKIRQAVDKYLKESLGK
ncbi:MAG: homocysteine S-methyltransferase family protein [Candidatus Latescibacter sp.]|nr:homocysteine S-methyltransferase family protein [Candidatus Latescibacter sp.]